MVHGLEDSSLSPRHHDQGKRDLEVGKNALDDPNNRVS